MSQGEAGGQLSEARRKEVFLILVDAQDRHTTVAESRKLVAAQFGLDESQIRQIEREGLDLQWPPLSES